VDEEAVDAPVSVLKRVDEHEAKPNFISLTEKT
jgi:hypothetical protein